MILLLLTAALASGLSGLGVPSPLGGFAGPSATGALGLAGNPASARPASFEAALDVAVLPTRFGWQLQGQDQELSSGLTPVPSLALAAPTGPLGVGVAVFVPFARGGDAPPEGSPSRFHTGATTLRVIEADLAVAAAPTPNLTVGGALRLGRASIDTTISYESAVLLNELLGENGDIPYGDPLFEGTESYAVTGNAVGGAAGLRWRGDGGLGLDLAWRSPLYAHLSGPLSLQPSDDLALVAEGRAQVDVRYPMEVLAAATLRLREAPWRLGGELSYTGWSTMSRLETSLSDFQIVSEDPLFQDILESYGLSEAEFLAGVDGVVLVTALSDILAGGLWVDRLGDGWQARAGAWLSPAAIPDAYLHPGNADFGSLDLRLAGGKALGRALVALSGDVYLCPTRENTDSAFAFENGSHSGMALPNSDGVYGLFAARAGLTVAWRAQPTEQPGLW